MDKACKLTKIGELDTSNITQSYCNTLYKKILIAKIISEADCSVGEIRDIK